MLAIVVCLAFGLSGHPPSRAQNVSPMDWRPAPLTAEDSKQDTDIDYLKSELLNNTADRTALTIIVNKQGEDIARLDTKMTMIVSFLGILQSGSILLSVGPLRRHLSKREERDPS